MPQLDAHARKIAEYAKVNRDRPDFEDVVRAMALAELTAAVHEETARCTALIREAMSGLVDVPTEAQRKRQT